MAIDDLTAPPIDILGTDSYAATSTVAPSDLPQDHPVAVVAV